MDYSNGIEKIKSIDKTKIRIIIGANIRRFRSNIGISIENFAELLDVTPNFLGMIERGDRGCSLINLIKIASILNIKVDELLYDKNSLSDSNSIHLENLNHYNKVTENILDDFIKKISLVDINAVLQLMIVIKKHQN